MRIHISQAMLQERVTRRRPIYNQSLHLTPRAVPKKQFKIGSPKWEKNQMESSELMEMAKYLEADKHQQPSL
jgi:hypothetical protein